MPAVAQVRTVKPVRSLADATMSAQDKARQKAKLQAFKQANLARRATRKQFLKKLVPHRSTVFPARFVEMVATEVALHPRLLHAFERHETAPSPQAVVDATPVRQLSPTRARLEQRAIEAVLQGTTWLTAQQVGRRHNPDAANPHAAASRWQQAGKVFAIERAGQRLYPSYVFDELGQPLPAVQEILRVLDGYTPFRIAAWFESTSSMLDGQRPRELLATHPAAVIVAAREHVTGPVHG